jgi:hypothetical protein
MKGRSFLLLLLLTLFALPSARASIALAQSDANDGVGPNSTVSSNPLLLASGDCVVVMVRYSGANVIPTVSDGTNTYTYIANTGVEITGGGVDSMYLFLAPNITGGSFTITADFGGNRNFWAIITHEYSGCDASPLDQTIAGTNSGGSLVSSFTTGSFTTTTADEALVMFSGTDNTVSAYTAGTGYTLRQTSSLLVAASEDKIVSAIQTGATASMSVVSGSAHWAMAGITLKASGSPPPPATSGGFIWF